MLRFSDIDLSFGERSGDKNYTGFHFATDYLKKRGIERELVDRLDIRIVPAYELQKLNLGGARGVDHRLAVVIPHFDFQRAHIDWWSARFIETGLKEVSFSSMVQPKGKMTCPPSEPPRAYLPPITEWKFERGERVYIHESAIKAINGALVGGKHIGLNGVWGWTSKKHGIALVAELRSIPWKAHDLQPVVVFDSNWKDNDQVALAIAKLGAKIQEITGRKVRHLPLPARDDGTHWGFDDFRVARGDEVARAYLDGEGVEIDVGEIEQLKMELNTRVCVVRSLGKVAEQDTGVLMGRGTFTDVTYATYLAWVEDKQVNVPRLWLMDSRRTEVEDMVYNPGGPPLVVGKYLNLWKGMGCSPVEGDIGPWTELLEKMVPDSELRKWMVQWFAYPLQNLGDKMSIYLHLYGPPGSGKNALLAPIVRMYGDNGAVIARENIASSFNSAYSLKQFLNLDELHGGNDRDAVAIMNKLKMLVTGERLLVNRKGEPEYYVDNHINLVTTSNYADSIKLDEGDRRACVVQFGTRGNVILDTGWWDKYWSWVDNGGAEALLSYLLRVDMEGFEPHARAPHTEWKDEVTDSTRGAMERWVRDLWEDPDSVLPPIMQGMKVLTAEQLGSAYSPDKNTPGLRNSLGLRMKDMGFKRSGQVKIDGVPMRLWIVRDKSATWTNEALRDAYKSLKKF